MDKIEATISVTIDCECPFCEEYIDLCSIETINDDSFLMRQVFDTRNNKQIGHEDLDVEIDCPECGSSFNIGEICWWHNPKRCKKLAPFVDIVIDNIFFKAYYAGELKHVTEKELGMHFFRDARGENSTAIKNANRKIILEWIDKNPGETMTACMGDTGLSYRTIMNHLKEMREDAV
jgi:hypothetical protein